MAFRHLPLEAIHPYAIRAAEIAECGRRQGPVWVERRAGRPASRALGIRGTPSFIFGVRDQAGSLRVTRRESGAIPFRAFAAMLDHLIAAEVPAKAIR